MVPHAAPNTHPGGFQGALIKELYHSDDTPGFVHNPPK